MVKKNEVTSKGNDIVFSKDVADIYSQYAETGSENLSASLPLLKVTEANSNNIGPDGTPVLAGYFYYAPTQEAIKEMDVSIISVSRGFYAMDNSETPKPKYTTLVCGLILETMMPFILFVTGTRLQHLWDFGKDIKPLTRRKPVPIPMFALKTHLSLERVKTKYGYNHVIHFDPRKDEAGQYDLITDRAVLDVIVRGIGRLQDMTTQFIDMKEVDREGNSLKQSEDPLDDFPNKDEEPPENAEDRKSDEDVKPDDIPF